MVKNKNEWEEYLEGFEPYFGFQLNLEIKKLTLMISSVIENMKVFSK